MAIVKSDRTQELLDNRRQLFSDEISNSAKGLAGAAEVGVGIATSNYVSAFKGAFGASVAQVKNQFGFLPKDIKNAFDTAVSVANDSKGYSIKDKITYYKDIVSDVAKDYVGEFGDKIKGIGTSAKKATKTLSYGFDMMLHNDKDIDLTDSKSAKLAMDFVESKGGDERAKKFAAIFGTAFDGVKEYASEREAIEGASF